VFKHRPTVVQKLSRTSFSHAVCAALAVREQIFARLDCGDEVWAEPAALSSIANTLATAIFEIAIIRLLLQMTARVGVRAVANERIVAGR
jgi:hypothetical protein